MKKGAICYSPFVLLVPGFHYGVGNYIVSACLVIILFYYFLISDARSVTLYGNRWIAYFFVLSIILVLLSIVLGVGLYGDVFLAARISYLIRCASAVSIFYLSYLIFYSLDESQINHFLKVLLAVYFVGVLFELLGDYVGVSVFSDLYKARQDLGGIDSFHYERFSGLMSYPGDLGFVATALMPVVLLVDVSVRTRLCLLLLLFFTLILSQSRLGIALFVISSALFYCMDKQIKKNWKFIIPALIFVVVSAVYVLYNLDALVVRFSYVARFYYEFDYYLTESKRASEWISLADTDLVPLFLGQPMGNTAEFYESEWAGAFARVGVLGAFWIFAIGVVALRALQQSVKLRLSSHIWLGCVLVSHVWVYCLASAGISRWKVGFVFLSLLAMLCSGVAKRNNRDSVQRIVS